MLSSGIAAVYISSRNDQHAAQALAAAEAGKHIPTYDAFGVPYPGTSMEVHGEDGAIVVHDAMTPTTAGSVCLHADGAVEDIPTGAGEDLYSINIRRFKEFIEERGTPTATAEEGLKAVAIALATERSIADGRTISLDELDVGHAIPAGTLRPAEGQHQDPPQTTRPSSAHRRVDDLRGHQRSVLRRHKPGHRRGRRAARPGLREGRERGRAGCDRRRPRGRRDDCWLRLAAFNDCDVRATRWCSQCD